MRAPGRGFQFYTIRSFHPACDLQMVRWSSLDDLFRVGGLIQCQVTAENRGTQGENCVIHSAFDGVFPQTGVLLDSSEDAGLDRAWPLPKQENCCLLLSCKCQLVRGMKSRSRVH